MIGKLRVTVRVKTSKIFSENKGQNYLVRQILTNPYKNEEECRYPNSLVPDVLKVTAGHEAGADLGPVISPASKERIQRLVKSAVDEGADVILDGTDLKVRRFDSKLSSIFKRNRLSLSLLHLRIKFH